VPRPHLSALGFACFGLCLALVRAEAATPELESSIKATYLYKFPPFVEWPAATFDGPSTPIQLCVVGDDAIGQIVDEAGRSQAAMLRPVVVRRLPAVVRDSGCHVVYIARDRADAASILERLRGSPVLTVTDEARDARNRGIVNFVVRDNRVRFEIDLAAAANNGLALSSKLLNLALTIRPAP